MSRSTSGDPDPEPCPACGSVVGVEETLDCGACPDCGTSLSELFRLASG